ncbi:MAG: Gfo/Idh/MocA family oxidoreductase [Bacteroidales bacterium]|jgi:predicted dehydrogenase|nr:Gfo/Idh/MocA family oxidoreductase [Bacteroidales bacterium]
MKLRMGMIGGGEGSLIGPVHRMAARLDGMTVLVCGAFSSDPAVSAATGAAEGLDGSRIYDTWQEMIARERDLPEDIRPHFISVVTPNFLHYGPVKMALEAGFHVVCDKPLCMSVAEAADLQVTVERTGRLFCLTHNYTGYPMVKRAREMVLGGEIGTVRKIAVEYFQGWLSSAVETTGNRQALWRSDPAKAGIAGAMADIGTHAFNLAEYVSGLEVAELSADLGSVVPGRILDDDGNVLLHFANGARGTLLASQIAIGEENNLSLRIYGNKGSISWRQMEPNSLTVLWPDRPAQLYRTGTAFTETGVAAPMHTRIPAGHPEGFIEAFANLYSNFARHIIALSEGREREPLADYPGIYEGVRGMKFLEAVVASSKNNSTKRAV